MQNTDLMSLEEIAVMVMKNSKQKITFLDLYNKVSEIKGFTEEQKTDHIAQFYTDITASGDFLYCGDDLWDLKSNEPLSALSSEFYSEHADIEGEEDEEVRPKKAKKRAKKTVEDIEETRSSKEEAEEKDTEDEEYESIEPIDDIEDEDEDIDNEKDEDKDKSEDLDSDDDISDEDDSDFDEEDYNKIMDQYEDQYDN